MEPDTNPTPPRTNARTVRRRALAVMIAFVVLSAAAHFVLGPTMTALAPHWTYANLPDQALSIVTLSHKEQPQAEPRPTPTPTPPPIPLPRTKRQLALLKYREMGLAVNLRPDVKPPARRKSNIVLNRPATPIPHDTSHDADVVVANPEPTPQTSPTPGGSRIDTGGSNDQLSGSIVWGDDNPPRPLKRAKLAIKDTAAGVARVEVQVDPNGSVLSVQMIESSGDQAVDQAALDAARSSTFAPATLNGLPVHGSCVMEFAPDSETTS